MTITGKTKLLGVIGYPVEHSLSPVMHNAAIAQMGLDCAYLPFPIKPEDLAIALAGFAAVGVMGFSVTIPHKQAIMPLLSEISDLAQAVGAVNTVWRKGETWCGTNTDVLGFIAPLKGITEDWQGKKAIILGNGGAARAVVTGCAQLGFSQITVAGRNAEKLKNFQESWQNSPFGQNLSVQTWENLPQLLPDADLVVNSTPMGMFPHGDASPLEIAEIQRMKSGSIAYDLIYTPRPTKFLQLAESQGMLAIDGVEMLVQQGAVALELWTGRSVPVDTMREALLQQLAAKH